MKINAIDIRPGFVLENGGKLMLVLKREIVQPGKGGAFTQIEMRDIKTGTKTIERYRTQETVERAQLEEKEMQFLYMDGNQATFMDSETFEQTRGRSRVDRRRRRLPAREHDLHGSDL